MKLGIALTVFGIILIYFAGLTIEGGILGAGIVAFFGVGIMSVGIKRIKRQRQ